MKKHSESFQFPRNHALDRLHAIKSMDWVQLYHIRPQVHHALNPLQFEYQENMGVKDDITYMLYQYSSHLNCEIYNTFLHHSATASQRNTARDKNDKSVGLDYRLPDRQSSVPATGKLQASSTGAPQGTVLSPVLHTSDFQYNSGFQPHAKVCR